MDRLNLEKSIKMIESDSDVIAVQGLRKLQELLQEEGLSFTQVMLYVSSCVKDIKALEAAQKAAQKEAEKAVQGPVTISSVPQCHVPAAGQLEIILGEQTSGTVVSLPGASAAHAEEIALQLKGALATAVANKSRFKLKVLDIKNALGDVEESVLRVEYDLENMSPLNVWTHKTRGEVQSLASVLRKAMKNALPDLMAA